jgi:hypothetical protein
MRVGARGRECLAIIGAFAEASPAAKSRIYRTA